MNSKRKKLEIRERQKEKARQENEKKQQAAKENLEKLKMKIWGNIDKTIIKEQYAENNRKISRQIMKKKRGRPKDVSYKAYEKYMKDNIGVYIKNNVLTQTSRYVFANKTLHMLKADGYAFESEIINEKMKNVNMSDKIKEFTTDFFA